MARVSRASTSLMIVLCVSAAPALAGDLNPPAGPVAPSMKTLDQIEPRTPVGPDTTPGNATYTYRITEPGSYYLTGNIAGEPGKHAIYIGVDNVSLDLMGFTIDGAGAGAGLSGITSDFIFNVVVRNGSVINWAGIGMQFEEMFDSRVENMRVSNCGAEGIFLSSGVVENCIVTGCGGFAGILADEARILGCTVNNNANGIYINRGAVDGCMALSNVGVGIRVGGPGVVTDCIARNTTGGSGFAAVEGVVFERCTADTNAGDGFSVTGGAGGCVFTACRATGNGIDGIKAGLSASITNCSANANGDNGIMAGDGATIESCSASQNTSNGFETGDASVLRGCVADDNGQMGIRAISVGCTISDCTASRNNGIGIFTGSGASVTGCSAADNGASGITTGANATVTGCSAYSNTARGISVSDSSSVINCSVRQNLQEGIYINARGTVMHCMVSIYSASPGIRLGFDSHAVGNNLETNASSAPGILAVGDNSRVEGNKIANGQRGIQFTANADDGYVADNVVMGTTFDGYCIEGLRTVVHRNTAINAGFTPYSIASGNFEAPISTSHATAGPWDNLQF